jgi:hypothetical protein
MSEASRSVTYAGWHSGCFHLGESHLTARLFGQTIFGLLKRLDVAPVVPLARKGRVGPSSRRKALGWEAARSFEAMRLSRAGSISEIHL